MTHSPHQHPGCKTARSKQLVTCQRSNMLLVSVPVDVCSCNPAMLKDTGDVLCGDVMCFYPGYPSISIEPHVQNHGNLRLPCLRRQHSYAQSCRLLVIPCMMSHALSCDVCSVTKCFTYFCGMDSSTRTRKSMKIRYPPAIRANPCNLEMGIIGNLYDIHKKTMFLPKDLHLRRLRSSWGL